MIEIQNDKMDLNRWIIGIIGDIWGFEWVLKLHRTNSRLGAKQY